MAGTKEALETSELSLLAGLKLHLDPHGGGLREGLVRKIVYRWLYYTTITCCIDNNYIDICIPVS